MRVRKSLAAGRLVASAAAVLLLSAAAAGCSGSNQKPAVLGPTSSASGASSSATTPATTAATSSASTSAASSAPSFTLPADFTENIDPDTTGDPVKDAILTDNGYFLEAYSEAVASGNVNDPLLLKYGQPGTLDLYWQRGVTATRPAGLTITGTEHIYKRSVDVKSATKADVTFCVDQSKEFNKEIATGKVHVTPVDGNSYLLYFLGVEKASNGIWQVAVTRVHQNDAAVNQECR